MMGELDLHGVFVPGLAAAMLLAFLLSLVLRRMLAVVGFYRLVWHRPLFDLALYVILLGCVVAASRPPMS
jgi:undecaprenyl pyrophosphate phosphatase UppP